MKVMLLGTGAADLRASVPALSDAEVIGRDHAVQVVGVLAPAAGGQPGRFLVEGPDPQPSRLVPPEWAPRPGARLGRVADAALERLLAKPRVDVVVTLDRAMLAAAVSLCPDRVRVVHRETRTGRRGLDALTGFAGRCDLVVADSEATAGLVREATGAMGVEVHRIPHAVRPVSGTPGRVILAPQGAGSYDFLERGIRAFALVADALPDWRLRVLATRSEHEVLHRLTRDLDLADRIEVTGPWAGQSEVWSEVGIGLLTSPAHADHTIAALAAASGVPVLAMDWPSGVRDVVVNGSTGLLVRPRSLSALAGGLLALAEEESRRDLATQARAHGRQFLPEQVADSWSSALRDLGGGGRVSRLARSRSEEPAAPRAALAPAGRLGDLVALVTQSDPHWFALRGEPDVLVLPVSARTKFLARLPGVAGLAATPVQADARDRSEAAVSVSRLGVPVSHLRLHLADRPVDVDFWDVLGGEWHAPYPHPLVRIVPGDAPRASIQLSGLEVPTIAPFDRPTFRDRPFPVDVVYTWVDGADPAWQARRDERLGHAEVADRSASGEARFLSRDELRYSMRSLLAFAPWVRTIFLVTDRQRPDWLSHGQDRVRVVDHTEILPASVLPTFNSHVIESALHRIEGLSEQFVYFNDDVLLGAATTPADFFGPGGEPRVFFSPGVIGIRREGLSQYQQAHLNSRDLVLEDLDLVAVNVLQHTPIPLRRSLLDSVLDRYPEAVQRTRDAPFRSPGDVAPVSSLVQHVGLATGRAAEGTVSHRYVDLGSPQLEEVLHEILTLPQTQTICLGDAHVLALGAERVSSLVADFLAAYLPDPAPWEIRS